jgi:hypothetical protein
LVVDDKEHGNKLSAPAKILGWFRYPLEWFYRLTTRAHRTVNLREHHSRVTCWMIMYFHNTIDITINYSIYKLIYMNCTKKKKMKKKKNIVSILVLLMVNCQEDNWFWRIGLPTTQLSAAIWKPKSFPWMAQNYFLYIYLKWC